MPRWPSPPRRLLVTLAILFAAITVLYSGIWMYYIRWQPKAQLGIDYARSPLTNYIRVTRVYPGSGAERAGLQAGDAILSLNGLPLISINPFFDAVVRGQPGDEVQLVVDRPGVPGPVTLRATLGPWTPTPVQGTTAQFVAIQLIDSYPAPFLVVALAVLFLRTQDRNAWLLALVFAGFIAGAPLAVFEAGIHPRLRGFAFCFMVAFRGMFPAIFYYFFGTFPAPSRLDRRWPRLKLVLLIAAAAASLPLALLTLLAGGSQPLLSISAHSPRGFSRAFLLSYFLGVTGLGLVSLFQNSYGAPTLEASRKTRVIVWGMFVGLLPFLLITAVSVPMGRAFYDFPFWVWVPTVLVMLLIPISFSYAVVKHRVLGIPVLLKRSARYVLVRRGFFFLLIVLAFGVNALFTQSFSRFFPDVEENLALGVRAGFLILVAWSSSPIIRRTTKRIDRSFFRSAYDARQILENLAERIRTAADRETLAALLENEIREALHPSDLAVYLENKEGQLSAQRNMGANGLEALPPELPLLQELAQRGKPWDLPPPDTNGGYDAAHLFAPLRPECLVPLLDRGGGLTGLVALGARLSEEPYSGEDKRLLASVASQAGVVLDNLRLAEKMAARIEAERRSAHEVEIARQVQARLFPQKMPPMETIDYAGGCIQARRVGGDYYDFLDLGPGRVGLVLADIAGKGISGALLMANLQANLRSQYAVALEDLPRLLQSVNQLFYDNTEADRYATLFFADYHDGSRRLRYANCGHNPPLLLRADGTVERLTSTTTVLGLFAKWECPIGETRLAPGDTLVIYTDGITEAANGRGEEFGEARLLETVRACQQLPAAAFINAIVSKVQQFSSGEQADDLTLLVARAR